MITLLVALAAAHHPNASARLGSGVAGGQAVVAPESGVGVDLSIGAGLSHFGRVAQDNKSTGEAHSVLVWSTEVGGRVWFPSGVFVSASMPVATTFVNGATWTGIGDVGAGVGLARTVGHTDGWVTLGMTAPTGSDGRDGAVEVLDVDTSDGGLDVRNKDIRTRPGLGAWALSLRTGVWVRRGRWALRSQLGVQTPVTRSSDGVRWGWDIQGAVGGVRTVGRVDLGLFADAWTHTADHTDVQDVRGPGANRRHGLAVRPVVSVAASDAVRVGALIQVPVVQWFAGTQLAQGLSGSVNATVRI